MVQLNWNAHGWTPQAGDYVFLEHAPNSILAAVFKTPSEIEAQAWLKQAQTEGRRIVVCRVTGTL